MKGILVDLTIRQTRFTIARERGECRSFVQRYFVNGEQVTSREYLKRIARERELVEDHARGTDA